MTGSVMPTHDRFSASGLYSYKLRATRSSVRTSAASMRDAHVPRLRLPRARHADGTIHDRAHRRHRRDSRHVRHQANPDDLRIKVAKPFAPLQLQEELGANLKAVDLDLLARQAQRRHAHRLRLSPGVHERLARRARHADRRAASGSARSTTTRRSARSSARTRRVTFARWLFGSAQFGLLAPMTQHATSRSPTTRPAACYRLLGHRGLQGADPGESALSRRRTTRSASSATRSSRRARSSSTR